MQLLFVPVFVLLFWALPVPAAGATEFDPWRDIKASGPALIDKQSQLTLALGVTATLGARSIDGSAQAYMNGMRRTGDLDPLGNDYLGTGIPGAAVGLSFWIYGAYAERPREIRAGQAQLEALAATGIATGLLKVSSQRRRPDGSDAHSFPSGHTSTVFATAGVLSEFYGWRVGLPAFALATLTGVSRMSTNRHWFSDVVGGATLGVWLAHGFAGPHSQAVQGSRSSYLVVPREDGMVATWVRRF